MRVNIHRLQSRQYQTSFVDPHEKKRHRNKFLKYAEAKQHKESVESNRRMEKLAANAESPLRLFLPAFKEKFPKAAMFTRSPYAYFRFIEMLADLPAGEINKGHLTRWLDRLQSERAYAARTMRVLKYSFNPLFTYLVEVGAIVKNPLAEIKMDHGGKRVTKRIYLSENEAQEVLGRLKAASPTEIYPVSYFQLHTAAYIGEVTRLRWDQVNLEAKTVSLPATGNTDARVLPLCTKLTEVLKDLPRRNDHVFNRDDGKPWSVVSYYRRFAKVREHIAPKRSFDNYAFRHTFAYHFLRKGGTFAQLQAFLGHRSIDMTVVMYGAIIDKKIEKTTPYDF